MSMAKKCDLCGVLYESYPNSNGDGISIERMNRNSSTVYSTLETMDCCKECMDAIQKLIGDLKGGVK